MNADPLAQWIHGPIVSCGDLDAHTSLFEAFGMVEQHRRKLTPVESRAAWGADAQGATEVVLGTPGTRYGVRLISFEPKSPIVIRDRERGFDADAPKVIDFYAPDFAAARRKVEEAGWKLREPVAEYDLPEGHCIEGHVWGPDDIVCALVSGPKDFFVRFATVTDRTFSEPQSMSGAVSELEPSVQFFTAALDLEVVYRYGIQHDTFRQLVGNTAPEFNLRAVNIGVRTEEPYLGLIHYGMRPGTYASLAGRARPPHRGTLGATIIVRDADEVARRVRATGGSVLAEPADAHIAPFGRVRSVLFEAPNGGCYQALATVT